MPTVPAIQNVRLPVHDPGFSLAAVICAFAVLTPTSVEPASAVIALKPDGLADGPPEVGYPTKANHK
jgi:hypothetical protein